MSEQSIPNSSWATPSVGLATGTYTKVTSVIIYSLSQRNRVTGNLATHEAAFKSAQTHSSILGWWSIFGVFRTPEALARNTKTIRQIREIFASGAPKAAWLRDPSGRFDERYWDGTRWTEQVRSAMADAPPPPPPPEVQ